MILITKIVPFVLSGTIPGFSACMSNGNAIARRIIDIQMIINYAFVTISYGFGKWFW